MIAEIGHFALILALATALVQGSLPLLGAHRGEAAWIAVARPAALLQFLFVAIAFGCLMQAYIVSDFSVLNVARNSHSAKPLLYKIAGVWGNHEGSLLLWILMLTLFGAAIAALGRNLPERFRARVLSIQALIGIGFLLFILFTSNPFERLSPAPLDGNGLNPLLQDPGLAFHPPLLYLGYVGFSITFSFAIAALLEGRVDAAWGRWVRPWTLTAWSGLTGGIALGSWWAYYELGWGGWWFWDPVENASFMPWLAGTALLHSAMVVEKREGLKAWTVLLAIITFSLSLMGTFLVRSGVLTSVHAFAQDPARGVFILAFLIVVVGGSLFLFALRGAELRSTNAFAPVSREGMIVLNNILLATATGTVLLGTLYPLFLDAIAGQKVTVGAPFFAATFGPLMVPVILLMAVAPQVRWKGDDLAGVISRLWLAFALAAAVAVFGWVQYGGGSITALLGLALGGWLLGGTVSYVAHHARLSAAGASWRRLVRLPATVWGAALAHAGMAVTVFGITAAEAWKVETQQMMALGESVQVGDFVFTLERTEVVAGPNYTARRGVFRVRRDGRDFVVLDRAETRSYPVPPMDTTEADIHPMLAGDLYAVIGDPDGAGRWATRLYYKPLISWIWGGALMMMAGGLISLADRRYRLGGRAKAGRRAALAQT